jgi:serine/threonine protein kinase
MLPDIAPVSGKYEILRKLNEGGMGAIYLVRHRLLDELRVIKVMRSQIRDEKDFRDRFVREARTAIQLRHTNLAQLYEFEVDDQGTAYMVLEYIDGRTLEELIRSGTLLSLRMKVEIALQCLRAIGFLHRKGFVHRDISPDNIMLTRDSDGGPLVKLLDLGIVKVLKGDERLTGTSVFLGKFRYASPEQLESSQIDARSDLYSFGVLLYELLTGVYPIAGKDMRSIMSGHLVKPPLSFDDTDPMGEIPEALRRSVLDALEKSPDRRTGSAEEFSARLRAISLPEEASDQRIDLPVNLDRILGLRSGARTESGTTQERLNERFDVERRTPTVPAPAARTQDHQAKQRLEGAAGSLARGELEAAESDAVSVLRMSGISASILVEARSLLEKVRGFRNEALVAEAERAFGAGRTGTAVNLLNRVLEGDPGSASARRLLERVSAAIEQQTLEERRREHLERLRADVRALIAAGQLREAGRHLAERTHDPAIASEVTGLAAEIEQAAGAEREREQRRRIETLVQTVHEHVAADRLEAAERAVRELADVAGAGAANERIVAPLAEAVAERRRALAAAETTRARLARASAALAEARLRFQQGDFESASRALRDARDAPELTADASELERRLVVARRERERQLTEEARHRGALAEIERRLAADEFAHAAELLAGEEQAYPDAAGVQSLRARLDERERRREAQRKRVLEIEADLARAEVALSAGDLAGAAAAAVALEGAREGVALDPAIARRIADLRREVEKARKRAKAGAGRPAPPLGARLAALGRWAWVGAAVGLVALVALVIGIRARAGPSAEVPLPAPAARSTGPAALDEPSQPLAERDAASAAGNVVIPAAPGPTGPMVETAQGTLVVDAQPWGEVLSVRSSDGVAVALPADRTTPLALQLPPGSYKVQVRHPELGRLTGTGTASSGRTETVRIRFAGNFADEFVEDAGGSRAEAPVPPAAQ